MLADLQALNGGRRLVAHHANVLTAQLHSFVLLALPSVEALRSTTSRTGMLMLQVGHLAQLCILHMTQKLYLAVLFDCQNSQILVQTRWSSYIQIV